MCVKAVFILVTYQPEGSGRGFLFIMREATLDTVIISSLISAASAIIVCIISSIWNNKLIAYRLEQLEKKMDKHNSVIDRVYKLEKDVAVLFDHLDSDDGK